MNGKIDTLTSGSMNNSLLMLTRDNSHGNNSAAGSLSNFAKGKGGIEIKGHAKGFKNGLANHQSVLKAAIFRNMRNKSEVPLVDFQQEQQPARDVRRGSIENHLKIQVDTRRSTFMSESPSEKSKDGDRQGDLSSSPEYEQTITDKENVHMNKLPQINSQKRYQPFTHR